MAAVEPELAEERAGELSGDSGPQNVVPIVRLAIGFYSIVALFAFGYALFSGQIGTVLGERAPTWAAVLGALGIGLVVVGLLHLGARMWGAIATAGQTVVSMIGRISMRDAAVLAGVSSIGEELLFRGALWPQLGLFGTTFLFGLVHVVPKRALWGYPIYAASAGLLLGVLRSGSYSVVPPILAHFTINFLCLWWVVREQAKVTVADPSVA